MAAVNWTNVTSVESLLGAANSTTSGWFWTAVAWFLWVIALITLSTFGFEVALLGASFFALVASVFLVYLGLIGLKTVGALVGIILLMFLYIIWSSRNN